MNPGIQFRLEKESMPALKKVLNLLINEYMHVELDIPALYEYRYHSRLFGDMPKFKWSNISQT